MTLNFDIPFPTVGLKFKHRTWTNEVNKHLTYEITRIAQGVIYIRAEGEEKTHEYTTLERWSKVYGGSCDSANNGPAVESA